MGTSFSKELGVKLTMRKNVPKTEEKVRGQGGKCMFSEVCRQHTNNTLSLKDCFHKFPFLRKQLLATHLCQIMVKLLENTGAVLA